MPAVPLICLFMLQSKKSKLLESIQPRLQGGRLRSGEVTLCFVTDSKDIDTRDIETTSANVPVVTSPNPGDYHFNLEQYEKNLQTEVLGQVILYADVVTSTMTMFEG